MPALLPPDEEDRLKELSCYGVLDTPPEPALDRITSLTARIFRVPTALVALVDRDRIQLKSRHGFDGTELQRNQTICAHTILEDRTLVVHDVSLDDRFRRFAAADGEPGLRFYAGTPLTTQAGHRLGTLCIVDTRPREFGPDDVKVLQEMAALVMDEFDRRLNTQRSLAELELRKRADQSMRATREELEVRIARRTTALVEAESRYRGIFENAVEGIYQAEPGGGFLNVNPAFAHLLGYASPEVLIASVPDLGLLYVRPAERAEFERRLEAEGTITGLESEVFRSGGARIWISENARAIRDGDANLLRYEGTVEDITDRRRSEAALQHAHEELEERVRERTAELALLNGNLRQLIAQREHAEATARRSESKFRALIENAQDLTAILTPDGVLVYSTPSAEHILGYAPDDLLGENVFESYVHPDEREAALATLRGIIETGESYVRTEFRVRHRDGTWRLLESVASPLPPDFPLIGAVVNSRDITDRRRSEQEAATRARQQTAIAELGRHALQGLALPEIFDHTARLVAAALVVPLTSVTELLPDGAHLLMRAGIGWREGTVGAAIVDYWRARLPENRRANDEPLQIADVSTNPAFVLQTVAAGDRQPVSAVSAVVHSEGRVFGTIAAMSVEPRQFSTSEVAFLQTVADLLSTVITSRRHLDASREVEARYQRIANHTPGMVYQAIRHTDGHITMPFVSEGCLEVCGLDAAQLHENPARLNDAIHPEDRPGAFAALEASTATLSPHEWEGRLRLPSGEIRWVIVRSRPERLPNGNLYRDGVVLDVTELKRAQEAMRAAKEEAEKANRAKSEFLSRMSHELRTPLNAILGFGQLLDLENLPPSQRSSVEQILKGGRHLLDLINEVLDIARIEAGSMELHLEAVDACEALGAAAEFVGPLARQHGVEVIQRSSGDGPFRVRADRGRLDQVLFNLLSNGVKYNARGGRLRLACRRPDARTVRLVVADDGPGLGPDDIARLFTPFQRLDAAERGISGTGIGLTISRSLIEAMGGRINVVARRGKGSIFFLDLPAFSIDPAPETIMENPLAGRTLLPVRTVLHIDDQPANLSLVERVLDQRPHLRLLTATDARSGLALAREHAPDLILLDLHLPDLPGDETVRRLRTEPRTRHLPILVLSADATPAQIKRLQTLGVSGYLTKPFKVQALLGAIDDALADEGKNQNVEGKSSEDPLLSQTP